MPSPGALILLVKRRESITSSILQRVIRITVDRASDPRGLADLRGKKICLVGILIFVRFSRRYGCIVSSFLLLNLADNLRFFPRQIPFAQAPVNSRERNVGREFFGIEVGEVFEEWFCSGKISALQ